MVPRLWGLGQRAAPQPFRIGPKGIRIGDGLRPGKPPATLSRLVLEADDWKTEFARVPSASHATIF
jgi:hypothetical protein